MIRLFEQHQVRETKELDGMWDFRMEGFQKEYQMPVPGCWEQHPDFLKHRGRGTYRRKIFINRDGNLRLEFKGVSHTADVYFDGENVAHHYNAFTPFEAVLTNVKKGEHEIRVEVDNTFGEHSALHVPNDYYTYGGITRPVGMELLPDCYIERIHFTPWQKEGKWHARMEVSVRNLGGKAIMPKLALSLRLAEDSSASVDQIFLGISYNGANCGAPDDDGRIAVGEIGAGVTVTVAADLLCEGVKAWSHETPDLYVVQAVLYQEEVPVDDLTDRVGFRTVEVKGNRICLNGKAVYLKGFNRHEDYAGVGCAIPLQLMVQDMDLMQEAGVNALRTCHYPNDERFLDLCDERGILVWEENHARGFGLERMQHPKFDEQCEDCIREMITCHYNHPSIIVWGILNECAAETEEGRKKYKRQYEQIKSLDASRPTTSATCRHFTDICLDLPDVVSFNMYSGWYKDCPVDERNAQEIQWIQKAGGAGKPIIVSELGAAAIYGYRDRARCKWSEERQADIIRENLEVYMQDENISGVFVWQFADCRVTEEEWFSTRARCHNNKGVVDEYRRPKEAFDVVKEMFGKYYQTNS